MAKTAEEKLTRARSWLAGRKWKVEKHRLVSQTGYESLTVKLNQQEEAIPRDLLESAVAAICADEKDVENAALGVIEGADYAGTWILREAGIDRSEPGGNPPQDNELVLWKRYVRKTTLNAAAHVMENNCTFVVTYTFHFALAALPAVTAGTSGITYRIMSANFDREDGLWDCIIEKREQLTTTTGVIVIEDDQFKTVYQQAWYGVRTGNTASSGVTLTLWDPTQHAAVSQAVADAPQGTTVRDVFVQKNENCTTDIVQQKTVAKAVTDAAKGVKQDVYEKEETATDRNQTTAVAAAVTVKNGCVTEQNAELNADGTFDNKERKVTELTENVGVDVPAQQTLTRDLAGTETTLEHANQTAAAALPETDAEGTLTEVVNRKTKAGRIWQTIRTKVASLWMNRVLKYRLDALEYVTEETHDGVTEETAAADFPAPAEVTEGAWTELEIETRPDKLKRIRKVTTAPTAPTTTVLEQSKTETAFLTKERTQGYAPFSTSLSPNDPKAAGGTKGLIERIIMTLRRDKLWDYVKESDTERAVTAAVTREVVTPWGKRVTTVDRAQSTAAALTAGQSGVIENKVTEGNLIDREKTVIELAAGASSGGIEMMEEKGGDFFGDTVRTEKVVAAKASPADDTGLITGNVLKKVAYEKDAEGVLRKKEETVTPTAGASFELLDQTVTIGGQLDEPLYNKVSEHIKVVMYMNVELTVPQAAAAAFVAAHPAFVAVNGTTRFWLYFYQHDIGFGLHVNGHGLWSGTLTMRATLTQGMQYTSVAS